MKHIDDIILPSPGEYNPSVTPNEVDSKVAYQLLEFLHQQEGRLPNCPKIKRYIKHLKVHFNAWYPKIKHCGCFN